MISVLLERSATVFYTDSTKAVSDIWAIRFSLDNKYIAIAGNDGQINVVEIFPFRNCPSHRHISDMGFSSKTSMCHL